MYLVLQASIVAAGAIPAFAELLYEAQPDGQYSAAAALYNLAADNTALLQAYKDAEVVEVLVPLLHQRSWWVSKPRSRGVGACLRNAWSC